MTYPDVPYVPEGSFGDVLYDNNTSDAKPVAMIWHMPDLSREDKAEMIDMLTEYAHTLQTQLDRASVAERTGTHVFALDPHVELDG